MLHTFPENANQVFLERYIETIFCQKFLFGLKTFVKCQKRSLYGKSDGEIPVSAKLPFAQNVSIISPSLPPTLPFGHKVGEDSQSSSLIGTVAALVPPPLWPTQEHNTHRELLMFFL